MRERPPVARRLVLVNPGAMKTPPGSSAVLRRTTAARRAKLPAAFEHSGMSTAAFARQYHLNYTTFCGWRHRRGHAKTPLAFAEVELPTPAPAAELVIELGTPARLRLHCEAQPEKRQRF